MSGSRSRVVGIACGIAAVAAIVAVASGLALGEDAAGGWQLASRYTARIAFPVFLTAFVAGPWHRLRPGPTSRWLVRHRRAIGLAFATIFGAHLVSLVTFNVLKGTVPEPPTLIVGGGALVATAIMAATSNDAAVRRLGAVGWRRLHTVGMWWLWLVFTITYGGRLSRSADFFAVFALACFAALALRIAGRRRERPVRLADAA
jgi:DMSO/TMAO reductase YedYZ heme-binding membrane subunit